MPPKKRINIQIFTDGSCYVQGALRPGGFGVYCLIGGKEICLHRGYWNTTTPRMEMMALLAGIRMVDPDYWTNVHFVSDSQTVVNAFKKSWLPLWRAQGWGGVSNADLWKEILKEIESRRKMVFGISWINGHGKDLSDPLVFGNACADELADYKSHRVLIQDKPLEGFSWFYHESSDSVFAEKTALYHEMNKMGDISILGDCFYLTEEELIDRLTGTYLFDVYYSGKLDVNYQIERI